MNSIYHILDKHPAIDQEDIQIEYEELAQQLVKSGRLRIDTDYYCNFIHYNDPKDRINVVFTHAELTSPDLIADSMARLRRLYEIQSKKASDEKISNLIARLTSQTKKLMLVSDETTIRLARIFVQSAHPIVIRWMLLDKVEVYITYSHSIGDVMNVQDWKRSGTNSGMQSTDGINVAIYVSCGGDPFAENDKKFPTNGNGWSSAARLQVIAGQEIGHYADIKRDHHGRQITRHSANFSCTMATPHVKMGRINDISRCNKLRVQLLQAGMQDLIHSEKELKFYNTNNIRDFRYWWIKLIISIQSYKFLNYAHKHKLHFIKRFRNEKYIGLMIAAMIEDMQSHLSPSAGVYDRADPDAKEAIACVEALARVPQQVMKWGYLTTRATMHDLYHVYYHEVIPSLIDSYNHFTHSSYKRDYSLPKRNIFQKLFSKITNYNKSKFKFKEVRDL